MGLADPLPAHPVVAAQVDSLVLQHLERLTENGDVGEEEFEPFVGIHAGLSSDIGYAAVEETVTGSTPA